MLRPEDDIMLRKLHDMLQSTADDLKMLSGELSKYHKQGVQVKTPPTPLDEEFNEKIHIEEIVNAKFHGYKVVDSVSLPASVQKDFIKETVKSNASKTNTKFMDSSVQVNYKPTLKKQLLRKNLGMSRTKIVQINEKAKEETENQVNAVQKISCPSVGYNEVAYKYVEPEIVTSSQKVLQIQEMPSINIRSELTAQKVLQLDINPDAEDITKNTMPRNALVVTMQHEPEPSLSFPKPITTFQEIHQTSTAPKQKYDQQTIRKVTKLSTCESSESTNNISSESRPRVQSQGTRQRKIQTSPKIDLEVYQKSKKNNEPKKESKRPGSSLDEWKKKLNAVYGRPKNNTFKTKKSPKTCHKSLANQTKSPRGLNNTEYIPYSKLTLGGVNISDIEKEICDAPKSNDIISPILDRILSRENSYHNDTPRKNKTPKILTSSDENLLQEVIDIESQVTSTLSKEMNTNKSGNFKNIAEENKDSDSYVDDFEDDKSDEGQNSQSNKCQSVRGETVHNKSESEDLNNSEQTSHNKTYTKTINLSFKNSVDVFEFVHSIETQETGTQSNASNKISPKETQTSPRNDQTQLQPIHNDLWSSTDSKNEVEKMFNIEKDFIKKLILDEYGDLLDKNVNKPSTSKSETSKSEKNTAASAKNTQTSPAHVKSVMTSPTRTKTRTTSPFTLSVTVNQQTSPMIVVSKEEDLKVEIEDDELGISVNLSSPRFSLRLPQSSRELLPNFDDNKEESKNIHPKKHISSSSSANEDYSSSDISSLGEITQKFRRKLRKGRIPSISELSSLSSPSGCSSARSSTVLPLRSDGEFSLGQLLTKKSNKNSKSEGEISLGQL